MNTKTLLSITLALMLNINSAQATQCSPKKFDVITKQADVIFIGKVTKRIPLDEEDKYGEKYLPSEPECGSKIATFDVYKTWKGNLKSETTVYSKGACFNVGSYFKLDNLYIVFANVNTKDVSAQYMIGDICDGTKNIFDEESHTIEIIKKLDAL